MPAAVRKAAPYALVDALLSGRHSQRSIARLTGVARRTIAKRIKKAALPSPSLLPRRSAQAQRKRWEVLGLDEWWSFVGPKRRKVWRWLVIERARRRVGGWAAGAKPRCASGGSRCRRITANIVGFSPTSGKPTPRSCRAGSTGPKGEGQTRIVKAINCFLRQRGGVLVRRSYSFSQSLAMHTARIKNCG